MLILIIYDYIMYAIYVCSMFLMNKIGVILLTTSRIHTTLLNTIFPLIQKGLSF